METDRVVFSIADYMVFSVMLALSACTGLYYVILRIRENRKHPYQSMDTELEETGGTHPFKVGLSTFIGSISAITYLGIPAEVYLNGSLFWIISWSIVPACLIINYGFLPVLYRLRLHSMFDYLEMRFNRTVRLFGVLSNFTNLLIYMSVIMYGLALALSAVTGVSLWGAILSIGLVRTVFTMISGITLQLWVELFQIVLMMMGFLLVIVGSCRDAGGLSEAWSIAKDDGRVQFVDFTFNATQRHSVWSLFIGGTFLMLCFLGPNQMNIERYRRCNSEANARLSVWVGLILCAIFEIFAVVVGIFMYSYYSDCDPFTSGTLQRPAELLPYFILDLYSDLPGTPGLLMSALFAASLSSTSAGLNCLASTTINDLIRVKWNNLSTLRYTIVTKITAGLYGLLCMLMAFLITGLENILQIILSWAGVLGGPILGIFTLGLFVSKANSKGALFGGILGLGCGLFFLIGSFVFPSTGYALDLYTNDCPVISSRSLNESFTSQDLFLQHAYIKRDRLPRYSEDEYSSFEMVFSVSYLYYSFITWIVTFLTGIVVSLVTKQDPHYQTNLPNDLVQSFGCFPKVCKSKGEDELDFYDPDSHELDRWQAFSSEYD